jgi:hypothetical protein
VAEYTYLFIALAALIIIPVVTIHVAEFYEIDGYTPTNSTTGFDSKVADLNAWFLGEDQTFLEVIFGAPFKLLMAVPIAVLNVLSTMLGFVMNPLFAFGSDFISSLSVFTAIGLPSWVPVLFLVTYLGVPVIILISKLPIAGSG